MAKVNSSKKFKKGQTVIHDYSKLEGEILGTRSVAGGYDYLVRWHGYIDADWFREEVLVAA